MATILHIINSLEVGGAESALFNLVSHDTENDHVVIALQNGGVFEEKLLNFGVAVTVIHFRYGTLFKNFYELIFEIRKFKPDIVQTWLYVADFIGGIGSFCAGVKKIVWCVRCVESPRESRLSNILRRGNIILSYIVPKRIVYVAHSARRFHETLGYDARKSVVVWNGVTVDENPVRPQCLEFNRIPGQRYIGLIARNSPDKGVGFFIDVISRLRLQEPNLRFVFVGRGMSSDNLELMASINEKGLKDYILLLGQVSDVAYIYSQLDAVVIASRSEAFPNVLVEAMLSGVPVVSTDVGDVRQMTNGLLPVVSYGDVSGMTREIRYLLSLSASSVNELRHCLHRHVVNNFSNEKMVKSFNDVYDQLL